MLQRLQKQVRDGEELIWLAPVAGIATLLFLAAAVAGAPHGISPAAVLGDYSWKALRALPLLLAVVSLAVLLRAAASRSPNPLRLLAEPFRPLLASPLMAAAALAPLVLMSVVFASFGVLKMLMPLSMPFAWDDSFAAMDRALFLGRQPWEITHALFGVDATVVIDRFYTFWVLLLSFAILGFALMAPRYDRARFFLSFTAAWLLLGVIGAYLFSSAGPCYAALIGAASAPEFAPLMERLNAYAATEGVHIDAVRWQGVLWKAHDGRHYFFGMGISAMPSLHNAIAVLYALALFRFGRVPGIAASIFALLTFVGSVHLAWHYAVDGIFAGVAMLGIWWAAGWYLDRTGYAAAVAQPELLPLPEAPAPVAA